MMNRIKAIALLAPLSFYYLTVNAQKASPEDSVKELEKVQMQEYFKKRPLVLPQADLSFLAGYQNQIYKRRLDSLQKTVPLTYNQHVQNYIDLYISKYKKQIGKVVGLSKYYFPIFEKALKEMGIPDEIKFITVLESSLNPHAVSHAGAKGLWQFMSGTAKSYGLQMNQYVDERKDPVQASYAAATYFKDTYKQFGDWLLAIAAYNCGTSIVLKAIQRSGGIADFWRIRPYLPKQTQNYVPAYIATNYMMNYYKKYGITPSMVNFNMATEIIWVNKVVSLAGFAKAAHIDIGTLSALNPSYNKQIIHGSSADPKPLVTPLLSKQVYSSIYDVLNPSETYPQNHHHHVTKTRTQHTHSSSKHTLKRKTRHNHFHR
ncbi:MAG: lytic transglycosylase [Pedobacter sp.]|nr:MAG: lytic transglycosylase [Pedobacter sp.]